MREGGREGEMQSEEMSFQSAFERGQYLCCSDVYSLQEGHSTIVEPEQRAVVNQMCRCDRRGTPDVQR